MATASECKRGTLLHKTNSDGSLGDWIGTVTRTDKKGNVFGKTAHGDGAEILIKPEDLAKYLTSEPVNEAAWWTQVEKAAASIDTSSWDLGDLVNASVPSLFETVKAASDAVAEKTHLSAQSVRSYSYCAKAFDTEARKGLRIGIAVELLPCKPEVRTNLAACAVAGTLTQLEARYKAGLAENRTDNKTRGAVTPSTGKKQTKQPLVQVQTNKPIAQAPTNTQSPTAPIIAGTLRAGDRITLSEGLTEELMAVMQTNDRRVLTDFCEKWIRKAIAQIPAARDKAIAQAAAAQSGKPGREADAPSDDTAARMSNLEIDAPADKAA